MKKKNLLLTLLLMLTSCLCFALMGCEKDVIDTPQSSTSSTTSNGSDSANPENGGDGNTTVAEGIRFQSFQVNGTNVYGKVSNTTESFSFPDEIEASENTSYVVSLDVYGVHTVVTKTVPLEVGDNTFYVIATIGDEIQTYTVTIDRRSVYTVTFNTNGGTAVEPLTVEEDSLISEPETSWTGYEIKEWDYDFTQPVTESKEITATWQLVNYTISYTLNGGTLSESGNPNSYNVTTETIYLSKPTREGYFFKGWYSGENEITSIETGSYGNLNLQAQWGAIYVLTDNALTGITEEAKAAALTEFKIPAEIDGVTITEIDYYFLNEYSNGANVTKITIPDSVTYISEGAFYACPSSIYTRYDNAYYLGNENNPYHALIKATSNDIRSCAIHPNTKMLAAFSFSLSNITTISIPEGVQAINDHAFYTCSSLTSALLPQGITKISDRAFMDCTLLTTVNIPDTVVCIEDYAFYKCSLENLVIPSSVSMIGGYAFRGLNSELFNEYDGCYYVGPTENPYRFLIGTASSDITECTVHEDTNVITGNAFMNCKSLASITIPKKVLSIGFFSFYRCESLTSVTFKGTKEEWLSIDVNENWDDWAAIAKVVCTNGEITVE